MLAELANEQTHTVSEWIEWAGGPCPVDRRALVQVQMRFELAPDESQMPRRAEGYVNWVHGEDVHLDILRYRVVSR